MKTLSIAIPCYNSESYMSHCINTLLAGGNDVEIIIVNDGSTKDNTLGVAKDFEAKYSEIIKVIDKPNGGHGSAVNAGIKNATGKFFKVVDSDDWVDEKVLIQIINKLKELDEAGTPPDMLLSNYIYDKQGVRHKKTMHYRGIIPQNKLITWDKARHFPLGKYILMHSIIYRTEILRECKLELPEHTFYVDNLFAFVPFPYVKKLYYMNVPFYHYFIGRNDQSVNEKVMISRIDQQLRVNYLMAEKYKEYEGILKNKRRLRKYMYAYLEIITGVSSILCVLSKNSENMKKKDELWQHLKETDYATYRRLNRRLFRNLNHNDKYHKTLSVTVYKISQKFFGFN